MERQIRIFTRDGKEPEVCEQYDCDVYEEINDITIEELTLHMKELTTELNTAIDLYNVKIREIRNKKEVD